MLSKIVRDNYKSVKIILFIGKSNSWVSPQWQMSNVIAHFAFPSIKTFIHKKKKTFILNNQYEITLPKIDKNNNKFVQKECHRFKEKSLGLSAVAKSDVMAKFELVALNISYCKHTLGRSLVVGIFSFFFTSSVGGSHVRIFQKDGKAWT